MGFPVGASSKEPTCQCRRHRRHRFDPWVGKIPWRRTWQPIPVFLPGKFHGRGSLVGYSPWGHKESDMIELLSALMRTHAHTHTHTEYIKTYCALIIDLLETVLDPCWRDFHLALWDVIDIPVCQCITLRCKKWWFDTWIYCKIIARIRLVNTSITSYNYYVW